MTSRRLFIAGLLGGIAAGTACTSYADELPTRVFHIGIVAGTPRSDPTNAAFEDRLRELGYVEGRNLTVDFVQNNNLDRLAAAVDELARQGLRRCLIEVRSWRCHTQRTPAGEIDRPRRFSISETRTWPQAG